MSEIKRINRSWSLNKIPNDFQLPEGQKLGAIRGMHTENRETGTQGKRQYLKQCIRCGVPFWSYEDKAYDFCKECRI